MKRYIKGLKRKVVMSSEMTNDDLQILTIEEAYESDGADLYSDIDEYSYSYYDMPASDIKLLYGLWNGSNEDTGIETTDGSFYIAYSGHGVFPVDSKQEMLEHFTY